MGGQLSFAQSDKNLVQNDLSLDFLRHLQFSQEAPETPWFPAGLFAASSSRIAVTEVLNDTYCLVGTEPVFCAKSPASMKRPFGFGSAGEKAETGAAATCFDMVFAETTKLCRAIISLYNKPQSNIKTFLSKAPKKSFFRYECMVFNTKVLQYSSDMDSVSKEINRLLNLVSRSFALCIPKLPKAVRSEIGNFYLLFRYADSIEDSDIALSGKKKYFRRFLECLKKEDRFAVLALSKELLPKIRAKNDQELFHSFEKVFLQFEGFDKKSKEIALRWLTEMVRGMQMYSKKEIENFLDLDNYCYYVAGTVGFFGTEICDHKFGLNKFDLLISKARDFGLLLQKVNIIRDFSKDYVNGKTFWPKMLFKKHRLKVSDAFVDKNAEKRKLILKEMVESAEQHIDSTLEYLKNLPVELRFACAIPFYMAVPTLAKCSGNDEIFDTHKNVKIGRTQTYKILSDIEKNAGSDKFLEDYLHALNEK